MSQRRDVRASLLSSRVLATFLALVLVPAIIFKKMFADFGQQLPAFTELCLKPWFPVTLSLVPLLIIGDGIFRNASRRGRALRMGLGIFVTLALPGVFLAGMYLPIFSIASQIK